MSDDTGGHRGVRRMRSPRTGLVAVVAGVALLTAACGSGSSSPHVASLGTSSGDSSASPAGSGGGGGSSPAATPTGNPTQLVDEWAACMRSHDDPGQADPVIDAGKVIHITMPSGFPGGVFGQNGHGTGPGVHCAAYLTAAQTALQAGYTPPKPPSQAGLLKYAQCMRANGIPDFPDPVGGSLHVNLGSPGGDLNPANPAFQQAVKVCAQQTGVHVSGLGGPLPPGTVDSNVGTLALAP